VKPACRTLVQPRRHHPVALACQFALTAMLALPAAAASRYWSFAGGCSNADWVSMASGTNADGKLSCWAEAPGGISGAATPTADDDVFIVNIAATAPLLVPMAVPQRAPFTASAKSLTMYGSPSFAAGLMVDRHALVTGRMAIGALATNFVGQLDQRGGDVSVGGSIDVYGGDYGISGGTLGAGSIAVRSQLAAARVTQTGGAIVAGDVSVGGDFGQGRASASWQAP
jgi:hypothetical protein